MIRKLNRILQDYLREKRLKIGRMIWDRKEKKEIIKGNNFIEDNNIKSILFLRYDGKIGDMVINTIMFREIKKVYPYIKIGVVTRGGARDIISNNTNVDKIYEYDKKRKNVKKLASEIALEKYDLLIDFSEMLRVNQMMFINLCKARFNIGLDKKEWKLFDISYSFLKKDIHISKLYEYILNELGLKNINLDYEIFFNKEIEKKIEKNLEKYRNKKVYIVNPFAASKHRTLNEEKVKKIIDIFLEKQNVEVFIIGEKKREKEILKIIKAYKERVNYLKLNSILETAYLIKKSNFIVTPDTSIVHIAACFKKNMIAIYRLDESEKNQKNKKLWSPNYKEAIQIYSNSLLVEKGKEVDINNFEIKEIEEILEEVI